jgi:acyl-CoA thioesterase-1
MIVFLLISCGNNKNTKSAEEVTSENIVETVDSKETTADAKTILFFGDSITAGYGLDDTNDAFPGILQEKIDSLGLKYSVINSGVSGETSAGGKSRINWVIKQKPTIFVLELGANDGLRGVEVDQTIKNLQAIINTVKEKSPETKIVLTGMQMPPNMGVKYTTEFKQLFFDLAKENNLEFVPFILEGVGGVPSLNQGDGIHPNVKGHEILAETVWEVLGTLVK